jgi:hypothetical protein
LAAAHQNAVLRCGDINEHDGTVTAKTRVMTVHQLDAIATDAWGQ